GPLELAEEEVVQALAVAVVRHRDGAGTRAGGGGFGHGVDNSVRLGRRCKGLIPQEEAAGPKARLPAIPAQCAATAPGAAMLAACRQTRPWPGGRITGNAEHVPCGARAAGPATPTRTAKRSRGPPWCCSAGKQGPTSRACAMGGKTRLRAGFQAANAPAFRAQERVRNAT